MKKVLLVDLTNIAFRYIQSKNLQDIPNKIAQDVISLGKSFNVDEIVCAQDISKSDFRKNILSEYKAQRTENLTKEEIEQRHKFYQYITKAADILETIDVCVLRIENVEADDIISWVVNTYPNNEYIIISSDADLTQLEQTQYSLTKRKFITYRDEGFTNKEAFVLAKAIAGDKSDNIDGVYGIGLKTALGLLTKYDTLNLHELVEKIKNNKKKGKRETRLLEDIEKIKRNLDLVDLTKNLSKIITKEREQLIKNTLKWEVA